jgi:hypothetical protein
VDSRRVEPRGWRAHRTASTQGHFLRGATRRFVMWRGSGTRRLRLASDLPLGASRRLGHRPMEAYGLRCCRNRMTSVHSRGSSVSRWQTGSGPGTVVSQLRSIRLLEQANAQGWTGSPKHGDRCIGVSVACVVARRVKCMVSRAGEHRRFEAEIHAVLLGTVAASEPSRGRAGTWQRQVRSMAAPPCRRVRLQHEPTRLQNGKQ